MVENEGLSKDISPGEEYLNQLGEEYRFYKDSILPNLSDEDLEYQKEITSKKPTGVSSFLAEFALASEEDRRNLERWAEGKELPEVEEKKIMAINDTLPAFVSVNPEALGAMSLTREKKYKIDLVVEDILVEVSKRLPRSIDAYHYTQGYAKDVIEVEGLGEIQVRLHETGNGIFRTINRIDSKDFSIWNCRASGVSYRDKYNEISRPTEIEIMPLRTEINLYDDDSGIYVGKDGKRFTNSVRVMRSQREGFSDNKGDNMYRTFSGPNPSAPFEGYSNENWKEDETTYSWSKLQDESIVWLVNNVLTPLKEAPVPESQATTLPEEEPFPEDKVGPLYTFVSMKDMRRISRIGNNPKKAFPEERKGVRPERRLLSLDIPLGEDVPNVAHDGFVWCGVGKVNQETDIDKLSIAFNSRRTDTFLSNNEGVAVIKPKSARDIYIVDWRKWEEYRENTFSPTHTRLTAQEYHEMYQSVGKTLIPITEYDGSYEKPVVLIGRSLELDEIESQVYPPEEKSNFGGVDVSLA